MVANVAGLASTPTTSRAASTYLLAVSESHRDWIRPDTTFAEQAMTNTHEREDLPELPVCVVEAEVTWRGSLFATLKREDQKGFVRHLYTADQMREYGRLCRAGREDELEALERNLVDAMNTIHRCDKSRERWLRSEEHTSA